MSVLKPILRTLGAGSLILMSSLAYADLADDITLVRSLAPYGHDIAQVQVGILQGDSEADAIKRAEANYLIQDLNADGLVDVVAIYEMNPSLKNMETNQPCEKIDYDANCNIVYGPRIINIYLGQKNGGFKISLSNTKYILNADEGGIFGDPLVGLSINAKKAFSVQFYGGSAWRWGYTDTIQYRKNDFYVIGRESTYGWTGDGRFESKSENLLTGAVINTSAVDSESPTVTKKYHVSVKPLIPFSNYKGQTE